MTALALRNMLFRGIKERQYLPVYCFRFKSRSMTECSRPSTLSDWMNVDRWRFLQRETITVSFS